jgi:hypothetical protein
MIGYANAITRKWHRSIREDRRMNTGSQHDIPQRFEDAISHAFDLTTSNADRDNTIDPIVFWGGSLKKGIGAEIVARRVDHLGPLDSRNDVRRPVARAPKGHSDRRVVVCLEDKTDIQCDGAVHVCFLPGVAAIRSGVARR